MTVKRYDSRIGNSMGLSVPCSEMYANPTGQFVTYSDYQKLVAENATMREAIDETIGWQESVDASNTESVRLLVALQTPSTDAAIAEIKASELDDLAISIMGYAPVIESDEYHVYEVIAKDVTDRAANLRAGRKG